jgi:hypothetical protein
LHVKELCGIHASPGVFGGLEVRVWAKPGRFLLRILKCRRSIVENQRWARRTRAIVCRQISRDAGGTSAVDRPMRPEGRMHGGIDVLLNPSACHTHKARCDCHERASRSLLDVATREVLGADKRCWCPPPKERGCPQSGQQGWVSLASL